MIVSDATMDSIIKFIKSLHETNQHTVLCYLSKGKRHFLIPDEITNMDALQVMLELQINTKSLKKE